MSLIAAVLIAAAAISLALSAVALSILGSPKAAKALISLTVIGLIGAGVAAAVLDASGSSKEECRKITNGLGEKVCAPLSIKDEFEQWRKANP